MQGIFHTMKWAYTALLAAAAGEAIANSAVAIDFESDHGRGSPEGVVSDECLHGCLAIRN